MDKTAFMSASEKALIYPPSSLDTVLENFECFFEGIKTVKKTVFVFSGHGTEWVGMGRDLIAQEPVFRQTLEACAKAHEEGFPAGAPSWNILDELLKPDADSRMGESEVAHPCLVALEIALVELLRSRGIKADAVVGHSVGEVAAAYCAGYLDIPNAFKAVHYQTEVMNLVRGKGRMLFIGKPVNELEELLYRYAGQLSVAAVNSHGGAVLSGTESVLKEILAELEAAQVFARMLKMDIPFHSHTMIDHIDHAPLGYAKISTSKGVLPFYSTVSGELAKAGDFDGAYWAKHISEPVLFAHAVDQMIADGHNVFIELGPHAAHGKDLKDAVEHHKVEDYIITGSLRRGSPDELELAASLALAHTRGFPIENKRWPERSRLIFDQVLSELTARISTDQAAGHRDPASWKGLDEQSRREAVLELIQQLVLKVAKVPEEKLADQDAGFMSLGINSIMSMQLKELLARELDLSLPNTLIFDYPSQSRLADFLSAQLGGLHSEGPIFANRAWKEVDDFMTRLEGMDDDEAQRLLEDEVERIASSEGLSNNKKLLYLLKQDQVRREPIAIVGMACRMPGGANDLEGYWRLLAEGRDGTGEIPADRWNNSDFFDRDKTIPGKSYVQRGGFLRDMDPYEFDPFFFKISPKEALGLDPQQRLLLEVAAEAFMNAGIPLESLAGSNCGSYVGICSDDYKGAHLYSGDLTKIDAYSLLGTALSAAGGRISFTWGLQGPAASIDTACSSSLIATHMAVKGIHNSECDMAVVAGVNYLLNPVYFVYFSKLQAVSPDGVCKTFDASANGYSRGEGCGVIILKRLSMAIENNDHILGIVRGSAINQDGASSGFTAPNGIAQQDLLQRALRDADLEAAEIDYIETHGTGTPLGDPIEAGAVAAVYGAGHDAERPLIMGSVKSSVGHLEGAAGVSGIIKILLSMQHGAIPANLHFNNPNPDIDWANIPIKVPTSLEPWNPQGKPRIAGVSGFGFSGSNAHIILQEAPPQSAPKNKTERSAQLLCVSAKDATALKAYAQAYANFLREHPEINLGDITYTSTVGRDHFNNRITAVAATHEAMAEALDAAVNGENDKRLRQGIVPGPRKSKIAWLFTGQGSQYFGMGRQLYQSNALFRERLDACAAILDKHLSAPLLEVLFSEEGDQDQVNQTAFTQPAIFAVEYALAELWLSFGIKPDYVMGHSVGEYVAAVISGLMTLEDGCRLIAERGRLMNALPSGGVMAAVFASREKIEEMLSPWEGKLNVAAHNSPGVNTVAGEADALEEAMAAFADAKIKARKLVVSHAFHSHLMDPMLEEFRAFAAGISYHDMKIPLISNVTCKVLRLEEVTPEYWCQHVRGTVGFHDSMQELHRLGVNTYVEVGSDITLSGLGKQCLPGSEAIWVSSLKRNSPDWEQLLMALGELHVNGVAINWKGFEGHYQRRKVMLPTYPYQRKRFYLNPYNFPAEGFTAASSQTMSKGVERHPLLGSEMPSPVAERLFVQNFDLQQQAFVADHIIYNMPFVPGTAYLEMGLAAARELYGSSAVAVADVHLKEAFVLQSGDRREVQSLVREEEGIKRLFIYSRKAQADAQVESWKGHADMGLFRRDTFSGAENGFSPADLEARFEHQRSGEDFYDTCQAIGYRYSNRHRCIEYLWWNEREAMSKLQVPAGDDRYLSDPGALDSVIQIFIATHIGNQSPDTIQDVIVPVHVDELLIDGVLEGELWVHFVIDEYSEKTRKGNMVVQDPSGKVLARINGITAQKVSAEVLKKSAAVGLDHMLWDTEWRPLKRNNTSRKSAQVVMLLGRDNTPATGLAEKLAGAGCELVAVSIADAYANEGSWFGVRPLATEDFERVINEVKSRFGRIDAVVHAWALGHNEVASTDQLREDQIAILGSAFHLSQALAKTNQSAGLYLLSQECFRVDGTESNLHIAQSGLYGFGNAAELEFQANFPVFRIDLGSGSDAELDLLVSEIESPDQQRRLALRGSERYAAKLIPLKKAQDAIKRISYPDSENYFLDISNRGILDNLELKATGIQAPGPGEVCIRVHATGLNFRDVLNALGQYPGDAGLFGLECSGIISAVGEGVTRLKVGDRVMANANGSFRKYITYAAEYVVTMPDGLSFEDAVTIPGPFLTAWYGLVRKGGLKKGDKVLIHAGAGGVGMAAVQIALAAGAEVFATASPSKQDFLKQLGVHHVHNSRTLDFADEIKEITGGKGVDLILNSLAGDFIKRSFDVMAQGGRFVEMGKMNIWTPEQVSKFNPSLSYHAFDLAADGAADPALIESMFTELAVEFSAGRLSPLPKAVFPFDQLVEAFRYMAQARHIGKIVISQGGDIRREQFSKEGLCRADATYILTGGLGALGLVFAEWLADNGARHLALFGRSKPKAAAEKKIAELAARGVIVRVFAADAADREGLSAVMQQIRKDMPPVKGIFHLAGLLEDGMILSSNWDRFEAVLSPKVYGGWNLHELSADLDLDMFVMFSSVAALFGNRGQSNYASANAFLDALVHWRRQQGMAATSFNWGPWGEVGMATDAKRAEIIAKTGFYTLSVSDGLEIVGDVLKSDWPQAGVAELNLATYLNSRSESEQAGFYEELMARLGSGAGAQADEGGADGAAQAVAGPADFWQDLASAPQESRQLVMEHLVKRSVAAVLNFKNPDDIDVNRPFRELGFDSLTNAEFINHLDKTLKAGLSQSLYMEFPTVSKMSANLITMPSVLDKLADVVVLEKKPESKPDADAKSGSPSAPRLPQSGKSGAALPSTSAASSGNGRAGVAGSNGSPSSGSAKPGGKDAAKQETAHLPLSSQGEGGLSYTSPVVDLSNGKAIEDQTDRYLQEHLSTGGKSAKGAQRSWWQRLMDALQDIES